MKFLEDVDNRTEILVFVMLFINSNILVLTKV